MIKDLKHRWKQDKEFYIKKEIGELQDFVKEILQDEELFNLKKDLGKLLIKIKNTSLL